MMNLACLLIYCLFFFFYTGFEKSYSIPYSYSNLKSPNIMLYIRDSNFESVDETLKCVTMIFSLVSGTGADTHLFDFFTFFSTHLSFSFQNFSFLGNSCLGCSSDWKA